MQSFFLAPEVGAFIADNRSVVGNVVSQAVSEHQLKTSLDAIKHLWAKTDFKLIPYREYKDMWVVTEVDDILSQLEEHQVWPCAWSL